MSSIWAGMYSNQYIKQKVSARSYAELAAYLGDDTVKNIGARVDAVRLSDTEIAIKLYHTYIITYHADGTFSACDGGWKTMTTKTRMDQFGPEGFYFYHRNGALYCSRRGFPDSYLMENNARVEIAKRKRDTFEPSGHYAMTAGEQAVAEPYRGQPFEILCTVPVADDADPTYLVRFPSGFELECREDEVMR